MSSPESWFVQTGFGTVLGPMPMDTLAEMVRTQELLPTDLVRPSSQDDWQLASEIPALFPNQPLRIPDAAAASSSASVESNIPEPEPSGDCRPVIAEELPNQPLDDTSSKSQPAIPSHIAPNKRRPFTVDRDSQSPRQWQIVAALAVVLLVAWWLWPRSHSNIYPRVVAIWEELQTRRKDSNDTAGWEQFLVRANSELDQLVPWLEDHASPKDRELQLLLFATRDSLRVMLKQPRDAGLPQEKRLLILFKALQELRDHAQPSQATANASADQNRNDSAKNLDPENSGSVLIIESSREPTESSDPATAP